MTREGPTRAVVLGATGTVGAAVVAAMLEAGLAVAAVARDPAALERLATSLAPTPLAVIPGDLEDGDSATEALDRAAAELGGIDVLVSCLGRAPVGDFETLSESDWQAAWSSKVMANVHAFRAALPHVRSAGSGRVVIVIGNDAVRGAPPLVASAAVDAALRNLVDSLNQQFGREGVSVAGVSPGPLVSPRIDAAAMRLAGSESFETVREAILTGAPSGEPLTASAVADLITYLVSAPARFVAGTTVLMDGGTAPP